jgi:hypothetical protein
VVRPGVKRHDFSGLIPVLNQIEQNHDARWKLDNSEMTSVVKFLDASNTLAASRLRPDEIVGLMRAELFEHA